MLHLKRISTLLAALLLGCVVFSACETQSDGTSSPHTYSSSTGTSSFEESSSEGFLTSESSSEENSSVEEDSSTEEKDEELAAMQATVDAAYDLKIGSYLDGTHTLTGTVTKIETIAKKDAVTITVEGRADKPILCFNLQGAGVSSLKTGYLITVSGRLYNYQAQIEFNGCTLLSFSGNGEEELPPVGEDPYAEISRAEFYANYSPATSNEDAYFRSLHGYLSGETDVPDQAPILSPVRPTVDGKFIRNEEGNYEENGDAYVVVDAYGNEAFSIYRSGGYITVEEVAAYVYAFGTYPANYTTSKSTKPSASVWGEHLRLNHTKFSGSTKNYPYEPELPNISGCGGTLQYYEMDIGTTGTDCDPAYPSKLYNDGTSITRGAARIVYGKNDLNHNGVYERGELHVFYTYNHYNDFQEYLNYEGGWGEIFGNITGGGKISSKTDYNPTPYVEVSIRALPSLSAFAIRGGSADRYKSLLIA